MSTSPITQKHEAVSPSPPKRQPIAPATHVGVLVIHGMGEEDPYTTLDQFARGLYDEVKVANPAAGYIIQAEWKERAANPAHNATTWTQAQLRFVPTNVEPSRANPEYLLTEYYWSPVTKGKAKDIDVLAYLVRSGLTPFRYLAENIHVLAAAGRSAKTPSLKIICREFVRLLLIFVPLLFSFLCLGGVIVQLPQLIAAQVKPALAAAGLVWPVFVVLRLLVLGSIAGYLLELIGNLLRKPACVRPPMQPARADSRLSRWQWPPAVLLFLALLFMPWMHDWGTPPAVSWSHAPGWLPAVHAWFRLLPMQWDFALTKLFLVLPAYAPLFWAVAGLGFAALIRSFLINFLGDVVIYTNLNQRSSNYSARTQIQEECGNAILHLYNDLDERAALDEAYATAADPVVPDDFALIVAAHSLGTVIAYDAVTDIFNRARVSPDAPAAGCDRVPTAVQVCRHLRGLFTFGSPLNKIYYLYRDISAPQMLIRAQVVDSLHSFRLLVVDNDPPCYKVQPVPTDPALTATENGFVWINAWSPLDPFCGELYFYDLKLDDNQCMFWYWIPVLAHMKYWEDPKVYKFFAERLL